LRSHCLCEQPCKTARCLGELELQAFNMLCDNAVWQLKLVALCSTMLCSYFAQLEKPLPL